MIGGTCLSFYDWYCDLPRLADDRGEQTDVPESADWYNSSYIIAWAPTCHRPNRTPTSLPKCAKGTKTIAITPDYSEVAKLCDQWLAPKQGTDSALAMAMGHVILKAFHLDNRAITFQLLPDLHRHADAGDTRAARRRQLYAGPYAACFRPA